MKKAVISGDIVAFTSLSNAGKEVIETYLLELLQNLKSEFDCYGRLVKGDYLECVVLEPADALKIALIIKSWIKYIPVASDKKDLKGDNRIKYFKNYGIRLAIGHGTLDRFDIKRGIIDGEAIYMSGRKINEEDTHSKERISVKNTLFFVSKDTQLNERLEPLILLLDFLMNKATSKQSGVLYHKLLGLNEEAISQKMGISQPVVNQHSTSAGWNAIEKAVQYFHQTLKTL